MEGPAVALPVSAEMYFLNLNLNLNRHPQALLEQCLKHRFCSTGWKQPASLSLHWIA